MGDLHLAADDDALVAHALLLGLLEDLLDAVRLARDARAAPLLGRRRLAEGQLPSGAQWRLGPALVRVARDAHVAHLEVVVAAAPGPRHLVVGAARVGREGRGGAAGAAGATLGARAAEGAEAEHAAEEGPQGGEAADEHADGDLAVAPDDDVGYGD